MNIKQTKNNKKNILGVVVCTLLLVAGFQVAINSKIFASCTQTVSNVNDSGTGSLRQAILNTNAGSGGTICFSVASGPETIIPNSQLPTITKPVVLDGSTQPGYSGSPIIELNGQSAGSSSPGLYITAGSSTVKGLVVNRFGGDGIIFTNNGGNTVENDYIGTNVAGTQNLGNGADGLGMLNSPNNVVGGTDNNGSSCTGNCNLISGNKGNGVGITGTGSSAGSNIVEGNYIGTNISGTGGVGNGADGLLINGSPNNTIGGTSGTTPYGACTGACNLISGNGYNGVGVWNTASTGNTVEGNEIGVNVSGTGGVGNANIAVEVNEAANNTVGGTNPNARNILSGNGGAGVLLTGENATGNTVEGNFIGTNTTGQSAIGNTKMGISIGNSPGIGFATDNTIGGTGGTTPGGACTGACNVIAGNGQNGIYITGTGGNQIIGNFIGDGASGGQTIANGFDGIGIQDSPNNSIGGPGSTARNIISGNVGNGVTIAGNSSTGNRIEGNYIGIGTDQGNMPNHKDGVDVTGGVDTAILTNSIFSNSKIGIDLGDDGVTANHPGGASSGPNWYQNYPVLTSANPSGSNTIITGTFNSHANMDYLLQFFYSPTCGPPGNFGQGRVYIGSAIASTDGNGNSVPFSYSFPMVPAGQAITATANKIIGSTAAEGSEFSSCIVTPRQHPDGTLVQVPGSSAIYMINSGQRSYVGSSAVFASQNFSATPLKSATAADMNLVQGPDIYFRNGTLVRGSSPAVYVIDQTGVNSFSKDPIVSQSDFTALGYTPADVIQVSDAALPQTTGSNISPQQHPNGTLVQQNGSSNVYLIDSDQLDLIGSPSIFLSQRFKSSQIKPATSTDMALSAGSNVYFAEGTLVQGSSSTVYVIYENSGTFYKLPIGSPAAFIALGYNNSDIYHINDSDLPINTGPSIN